MASDIIRILVFAGSTREGSLCRKLASAAANAVREAGGEATLVELRDLPMPLYDADLQAREGFPENVHTFRALVASHDGFLIVTPEYNHGISGVLKNALDWASRGEGAKPVGVLFRGKPAVILSAAPGVYGGVRALIQLRAILAALDLLVLPGQLALARAKSAFHEDGSLVDPKIETEVLSLPHRLVELAVRLEGKG